MKEYEKPIIEIVMFGGEDVIYCSPPHDDREDDGWNGIIFEDEDM